MTLPKPFTLVLGGGGARGYIHLGVLKYLEEHDIVPDQIVGTSMGAIIGSAWAVGMTAQQIQDAFESISWASLFDVDFKTASIQGGQVEKILTQKLGNIQIQDIKIPLGITATCLDDGSSTLFESGPLIDAIRASISIPGLFSPRKIEEMSYLDGGLTANLPVKYATYDQIVAVSAARAQDLEIQRTSQRRRREIPKNPLAVNKEILAKGYNLLLRTQEDQALQLCTKDVTLIRPHNHLRLLDMDKISDAVVLGYEQAKRILQL